MQVVFIVDDQKASMALVKGCNQCNWCVAATKSGNCLDFLIYCFLQQKASSVNGLFSTALSVFATC